MPSRKELSEKFLNLKDQKSKIEIMLDQIKEDLNATEQDLILSMEEEGLQSFKDEEGRMVYLRQDTFASIEDHASLFHFLRENGLSDIIKQTVNAKTLASLSKDHPVMPGAKISYVTKLGVRK